MFNATFNNISVISWRHGELKIYIETVLKIYDEVLKQSWCLVNNYDELVVIFYSQFKTSVLINCHTNTNSTECTVWEYIFCDLRVSNHCWTFKSLVEVSKLILVLPGYGDHIYSGSAAVPPFSKNYKKSCVVPFSYYFQIYYTFS